MSGCLLMASASSSRPDSSGAEFAGTRRNPPERVGILRNRLDQIAHKVIAQETAIDASHVGKVLAGTGAVTLPALEKLLQLVGLKLVSDDRVCVRGVEIELLRKIYAKAVDHAPWLLDEGEG